MSDTKSWYNSNILSGLNHAMYNLGRPVRWVDGYTNVLNNWKPYRQAHEYMGRHGGDALATVGAIVAAYYGAEALASEGGGGAAAGGAVGGAGGDTAMGGAAGELGAVDSEAASEAAGYTAGDVGGTSGANLTSYYGESGTPYGKYMQEAGKVMQSMSRRDQEKVDQSRVNTDTPPLENPYATSTKAAKTLPTGDVDAAMLRGASGADGIDANGVQTAAIQELTRRINDAKKRLGELQKEQA